MMMFIYSSSVVQYLTAVDDSRNQIGVLEWKCAQETDLR